MSLESVFKLSLIMNMIDNLSGPMAGVASKVGANVSKLDAASQTFGSMAKAGAAMQETGSQIVNAVLAPVEATFETRRALGELASLGVQDLEAVENAARSFSDQWAGTSKADFISAATTSRAASPPSLMRRRRVHKPRGPDRKGDEVHGGRDDLAVCHRLRHL